MDRVIFASFSSAAPADAAESLDDTEALEINFVPKLKQSERFQRLDSGHLIGAHLHARRVPHWRAHLNGRCRPGRISFHSSLSLVEDSIIFINKILNLKSSNVMTFLCSTRVE